MKNSKHRTSPFLMSAQIIKSAKDTLFNFLTAASSFVGGVILSILVARELGPELMGQYSFIVYLIALTVTIFSLGLPSTLTKYISEYAGQNDTTSASRLIVLTLKILIILSLVSSLVFIAIFSFIDNINPLLKSTQYAILAVLCIAPTLTLNVFKGILSGFQDFSYLFKVNFISTIILILTTFLVLFLNLKIAGLLAINILTNLVGIVLIYQKYKKHITSHGSNQKKFEYSKLIEIYKYLWPLTILSIIDMIVWQYSEVIFLAIFRTSKEIAFYTIPFSMSFMIMSTLPGSFIAILTPLLSNLYGKNSTESMKNVFYTSFKYVVYLVIPTCFGISIFSKDIINLFYGENFLPAHKFLTPLIISSGLGFISATGASLLYSVKKQMTILKLMSAVVFINISLDIMLIPSYGVMGAVIANVSAQLISAILTLFFAFNIYKKFAPLSDLVKPLFSASLMSLILYPLNNFSNNILWLSTSILLGVFSYLLFMIIFKSFNDIDKNILLEIGSHFPYKIKSVYNSLINKLII